jgi:hypothetical protein
MSHIDLAVLVDEAKQAEREEAWLTKMTMIPREHVGAV